MINNMAEIDTKQVINNKNDAINKLNKFLDSCIIQDNKHLKKANLLSYWFKDFINYIKQEETFNSSLLKEYSRGDIIKVNLGFNVGNEEGGLHYCVVLDKKNAKSYSTLTVVPLSSLKETTKLNKTSVLLGNEIYNNLFVKSKKMLNDSEAELKLLEKELNIIEKLPEITEEEKIVKKFKQDVLSEKIDKNTEKLLLISKITNELFQMKKGTIALVNQITTISKQRIYNPKKDFDILSGIKVSDEKMKLIDEKIKKLYVN